MMTPEFQTTDIVLTASLIINGYNIKNIVKHGNKGTFIFESVDEDFIKQYDLGQITVEPISFNNMIKQLTTSVRRI